MVTITLRSFKKDYVLRSMTTSVREPVICNPRC